MSYMAFQVDDLELAYGVIDQKLTAAALEPILGSLFRGWFEANADVELPELSRDPANPACFGRRRLSYDGNMTTDLGTSRTFRSGEIELVFYIEAVAPDLLVARLGDFCRSAFVSQGDYVFKPAAPQSWAPSEGFRIEGFPVKFEAE